MPGEDDRFGETFSSLQRADDPVDGSLADPALNPKSGRQGRRALMDDRALSHTHATLLMVAITVILAVLVLLMALAMIPSWSWAEPSLPPIVITGISHASGETGKITYASRVSLLNNGSTVYENDRLQAVFYRDGQRASTVQTLNGYRLISSHHYGVKYVEGEGCRSPYWNPGEELVVDLTDGTLVPGVMVTVEIVDRQTGGVISKHSARA
ncbi:MAG: type IV pilin [Methanoculleus sp.]